MPSRCGIRSRQLARSGEASGAVNDLEVDGAVGIGEDEQFIAAVGERILHAFLARRDQPRRRIGIGEVDQPLLRGFMVAAGDHAEAAGRALMQMGEPAGILFLIDQRVVRLLRAQPMPPDLHRAVVVVELDVEEAVAIRAPDHAAVGLLDEVVAIRRRSLQSRTRIEKYSEPLVSAVQACSLWSGECRALPNLK